MHATRGTSVTIGTSFSAAEVIDLLDTPVDGRHPDYSIVVDDNSDDEVEEILPTVPLVDTTIVSGPNVHPASTGAMHSDKLFAGSA